MIHYYPFDGRMDNIIDPLKPGQAGSGDTVSNASDRFNQADRAYSINDSSNQVLEIPPETLDGHNSFTICLWIKSNKISGSQGYLSVASDTFDNELLVTKDKLVFKVGIAGPYNSSN